MTDDSQASQLLLAAVTIRKPSSMMAPMLALPSGQSGQAGAEGQRNRRNVDRDPAGSLA